MLASNNNEQTKQLITNFDNALSHPDTTDLDALDEWGKNILKTVN